MNDQLTPPEIRADWLDPFEDLDPYYEHIEGTDLPNVYKQDVDAERAEHERMGAFFKQAVRDVATARKSWLRKQRDIEEGITEPINDKERRILSRNFGEGAIGSAARRKILSGRGVHFKNLGCYQGELRFEDRFEDERLARGLFQPGAKYRVIVRYSNGKGGFPVDNATAGHGCAVKLLPEDAEPAEMTAREIEEATLLNMANINFPVTFMFNPHQYNAIIHSVAPDPDATVVPETLLQRIAARFENREFDLLIRAALGEEGFDLTDPDVRTVLLLVAMNGKLILNPLFQEYHSMSAYRLGGEAHGPRDALAVKYLLRPEPGQPDEDLYTRDWTDIARPHLDVEDVENCQEEIAAFVQDRRELLPQDQRDRLTPEEYLRPMGEHYLSERPFSYRFALHRFLSFADTPTEDPTVQWFASEEERDRYGQMWERLRADLRQKLRLSLLDSLLPENTGLLQSVVEPAARPFMERAADNPPADVARLTLDRLTDDNRIDETVAEQLSFNVWQRVPVLHKPLGRVNRMRHFSYQASLDAREAEFPQRES
jgi:hypothetical protein